MNIHESQLDEFKDEATFQKLNLMPKQVESWLMVRILCVLYLYTHTHIYTRTKHLIMIIVLQYYPYKYALLNVSSLYCHASVMYLHVYRAPTYLLWSGPSELALPLGVGENSISY